MFNLLRFVYTLCCPAHNHSKGNQVSAVSRSGGTKVYFSWWFVVNLKDCSSYCWSSFYYSDKQFPWYPLTVSYTHLPNSSGPVIAWQACQPLVCCACWSGVSGTVVRAAVEFERCVSHFTPLKKVMNTCPAESKAFEDWRTIWSCKTTCAFSLFLYVRLSSLHTHPSRSKWFTSICEVVGFFFLKAASRKLKKKKRSSKILCKDSLI